MAKVFLKFGNELVKRNFTTLLLKCEIDVVENGNDLTGADYVLDDVVDGEIRVSYKNGEVISVFRKPVDIRDVVRVFERLKNEQPLWYGASIVVNFSVGIAKVVTGKNFGKVVLLTDLQQKLLKILIPVGIAGLNVDDACLAIYGKIDVWSKSNLDMLIYNLNKRLETLISKPKLIVKRLGDTGTICFSV